MQKLIWTNANGDSIDLTSGNYGITNWEGFSNTSLNIQSQQVPFQDGSVYLDALMEQRELTVTLAMQDNNNLELRYQLRRELIHILNPKLGEGYLIYKNDYTQKRIKCVPQIPLFETHNSDMTGTPKASLTWTACEPYWEDVEEKQVFFSVGETLVVTNDGDVPAQPIIDFFGTSEKSEIRNLTTKQKIEINTSLREGVIVNTENGNKSIFKEEMTFSYLQPITHDIIWINDLGIFVTVGESYNVLTSQDGIKWTLKTKFQNKALLSIAYAQDLHLFVAVGYNGLIITSPDCINWTTQTSGVNKTISKITYSEELHLFVAVGDNGMILTSQDGIEWEKKQESVNLYIINDVIYIEELHLFIAVGALGYIFKSTDGNTWSNNKKGNEHFNSVAYSEEKGMFVIVGTHGTIYYSEDGTTWILQQESLTNYNLRAVIYSQEEKLFFCYGDVGVILTSKNGSVWIKARNFYSIVLKNVTYSKELNLFVGAREGYPARSYDGINWVVENGELQTGSLYPLYGITYSEELHLFVAVGGYTSSTRILTSQDGIEWIIGTSGIDVTLRGITYSEELHLFVAVGDNGMILTSQDGTNWTTQTSGVSNNLYDVVYSEDKKRFVAVGNGGTVLVSEKGENWTYIDKMGFILSITYAKNLQLFAYVGEQGMIAISSNGIDWIGHGVLTNNYLRGITYSEELHLFVAVGDNGMILTSQDGIEWIIGTSGIDVTLRGITYSEELHLFVAVGDNGMILTSSDGTNWNGDTTSSIPLNDIVYSERKFIAVAGQGNILYSEFQQKENIIQYLTKDSDMTFKLQIGENQLQLAREDGSLFSRIKYRQKYIGV